MEEAERALSEQRQVVASWIKSYESKKSQMGEEMKSTTVSRRHGLGAKPTSRSVFEKTSLADAKLRQQLIKPNKQASSHRSSYHDPDSRESRSRLFEKK